MLISIDNFKVSIDIPKNTHIGVMLSGGMDSALMLYLILKELNSDNVLTIFTVPNSKCNSILHAQRVVKFLENIFNKKLNLQIIGFEKLPHNMLIKIPSKIILQNNLVDILFSATNQIPPVPLPEHISPPWRADPNGTIHKRVSLPFIKLNKKEILEIYQYFNILELAYITHSCTESTNERCNKCFQCFERQWAFDELKLINHDTRSNFAK